MLHLALHSALCEHVCGCVSHARLLQLLAGGASRLKSLRRMYLTTSCNVPVSNGRDHHAMFLSQMVGTTGTRIVQSLFLKPCIPAQIAKEVAAAVRAAAPRVAELDRKRKADLASRLTARWQRWELSNFDYLMQLNTLAGASTRFLSARSITLGCCNSQRLSYVSRIALLPRFGHRLHGRHTSKGLVASH